MDLCGNRIFSSSRRDALRSLSCGFGLMAFAGIASKASGSPLLMPGDDEQSNPLAPKVPHFPGTATRVICRFSASAAAASSAGAGPPPAAGAAAAADEPPSASNFARKRVRGPGRDANDVAASSPNAASADSPAGRGPTANEEDMAGQGALGRQE
jgi:hypothetical protein